MNDIPNKKRRALLGSLFVAPGLLIARKPGHAQDPLPKLAESDPVAKALAYHHDADAAAPSELPGRNGDEYCRNCNFIRGEPGPQWRACQIFPGKRVNIDGWCRTWAEQVRPR